MTAATVLFVGPPNAGKSTLFNRLTGAAAHVGNYPGITVEQYAAPMELPGRRVQAVDLPGTYSLAARSPDERIALDALLGRGGARPDAALVVLDGARLARGLYLALQVLELGIPCVIAVNLMDEARARGVAPDVAGLATRLGVPCVPVVGRTGEGIDALRTAIGAMLADPRPATSPVAWPAAVDADVDALVAAAPRELAAIGGDDDARRRAVARWALLSLDPQDPPGFIAPALHDAVRAVHAAAGAAGRDVHGALIGARYAWIDAVEAEIVPQLAAPPPDPSDRIDRWLLDPRVGVPIFVATMAIVFVALFSWADPLIGLLEDGFGVVGDLVAAGFDALPVSPALAPAVGLLRDLVVDGLVGGVGAVVVFVPQIAILSLLIAVLEDSGYLARAALLMDRILRLAGLPGRAFVPLMSGFACAVPAIQATRTLPRFRDRLLTMLVVPLTSCSARLPVYTLLIGALFPATIAGSFLPIRPAVLLAMYLFSTVVTLVAAVVLGRTVAPDVETPAVLELPPWRVPLPGQVLRVTWRRTWGFLREAGGVILVATVVLWALLTFPRYEPDVLVPAPEAAALEAQGVDVAALRDARALERSYAGQVGHLIEPAIAPLGFDWRIGIGILGSFAAREVFVSTMGVVHGVGEADESSEDLRGRMLDATRPDGAALYTPLVGVSLMVFFALAMQCISTLAVLRRESGSWRWPVFAVVWMTALAWVGSFVVFQGGRLLGLG